MSTQLPKELISFVAALCPHLPPEEQAKAAEELDKLTELFCQVIIRIASDPKATQQLLTLTDAAAASTIQESAAR